VRRLGIDEFPGAPGKNYKPTVLWQNSSKYFDWMKKKPAFIIEQNPIQQIFDNWVVLWPQGRIMPCLQ